MMNDGGTGAGPYGSQPATALHHGDRVGTEFRNLEGILTDAGPACCIGEKSEHNAGARRTGGPPAYAML